jgi:hypothetical protein
MTLPQPEVYKLIGQAIYTHINTDWLSVQIQINVSSTDVLNINSTYQDKNGKIHHFDLPNTAIKEFYHLYVQMSRSTKGQWKQMIYTLTPDGDFNISFEY